ncbi:MAG: hypothetical protein AAB540_02590 [Patescibacteria group bacterium]
MPNSLKLRLKMLALPKKIILVGSFVAFISVFMPWYSDIDRFKIGDTFLGITGPLYLAGLFVFLASAASLLMIIMILMEKPLTKLPLKESHMHIFNGSLSFLMLILTASVYFHPKFGLNITEKNLGFGMIMSFIGIFVLISGSILLLRTKEVNFEEEGHIEPLIKIETDREKGDLSLKRDMTIEEAMTTSNAYKAPTKVWGPVQESLSNLSSKNHDSPTEERT